MQPLSWEEQQRGAAPRQCIRRPMSAVPFGHPDLKHNYNYKLQS